MNIAIETEPTDKMTETRGLVYGVLLAMPFGAAVYGGILAMLYLAL